MRDIGTATLSGNLTRDVELKSLPSGGAVARLRVATTTRRRSGEEWIEKTNYFTVEVYGAQARSCARGRLMSGRTSTPRANGAHPGMAASPATPAPRKSCSSTVSS